MLIVWLWRRRQIEVGPQEFRVRTGNIRAPSMLGPPLKRRPPGSWALYIALPIGGLSLICFLVMRAKYGYDAIILADRGQAATAVVTIDGLPRNESSYEFYVDD